MTCDEKNPIFPSNKNRALLHLKIEWIRYLFFSYFCSDIHNHRQHKEGRMTALKPEWQMNTQWLKKHLRDSYIRSFEENLPKGKGFQPDPSLCKTNFLRAWFGRSWELQLFFLLVFSFMLEKPPKFGGKRSVRTKAVFFFFKYFILILSFRPSLWHKTWRKLSQLVDQGSCGSWAAPALEARKGKEFWIIYGLIFCLKIQGIWVILLSGPEGEGASLCFTWGW